MAIRDITTDAANLRDVRTGRGSFLLFAEQDGKFNNKVASLDNFYTLKQSIINTSLQINSPQLNVATIPVGRAPFPGQAGPKDVQGSFNITAPLRFSELLWRNLINAKTVGSDVDSIAQAILTATALPTTANTRPDPPPAFTAPSDGVAIRLELTLSANTDANTVTIYGTNQFDERIRETVNFPSGTTEVATNSWFKTVTSYSSSAVGPVTLQIDRYTTAAARTGSGTLSDPYIYNDGGQWTNLTLGAGSEILNGLTIVQVIGGTTGSIDTFFDCWLQSVNFRFAREEVVAEEWTVVGRDGDLTVAPDGIETATSFVPRLEVGGSNGRLLRDIEAPPDGDDIFRDADIRGISGWQTGVSFQVPGQSRLQLAVIDGTATFNANTNFVPRTGSRSPGSAFQRTAESTVQLTVEFHQQYEPFVQAQLDNETIPGVRLEMTALTETGFPAQRFITLNQLELTEAPTRNVDSDNYVSLGISGRVLPSTPSATDDIAVTLKVPGRNNANYRAWAGLETPAGTTPTDGQLRVYS